MTIAIPVLNRCTKQSLLEAKRSIEMTFTAARVLEFLIYDPTAPYWCVKRMAIAVGRSPRMVDVAIAELKKLGFIDVFYRRRGAAVKILRVDAILHAVSRASSIARQAARAVQHTFLRAFQATQRIARYSHLLDSKSAETASWKEQKAPTASLLRSGLLATGTKRST